MLLAWWKLLSKSPGANGAATGSDGLHPSRNRRLTIDRDPRFKCFGCCHVRTGALVLASYYLVIQAICVALLCVAIVNPSMMDMSDVLGTTGRRLPDLDGTQQTSVSVANTIPFFDSHKLNHDGKKLVIEVKDETQPQLPEHPLRPGTAGRIRTEAFKHVQQGDAHLALALVLGLMSITLLMTYGVIKARPVYLLPFFSYQVFDFILGCLTTLGHYSWLPHVQAAIHENPSLPYHSHLTQLNAQWLSLGILLACVFVLILKAYLIGIVWACYQYLNVRAHFSSIVASRRGEMGDSDFDEEDAAWRSLLAHHGGRPMSMGHDGVDPMFYFAGAGIAPPPTHEQLLMTPPDYDTASKMPPAYGEPGSASMPAPPVNINNEPPPSYSER